MKLLFIQGGSRVRVCKNKKKYVDTNFNNNIWKRYKAYCDELTVILRTMPEEYEEKEIKNKLNEIDTSIMNLVTVDDIYSPKKNIINISKRKKISRIIEKEVKNSDKVIIRSIGNFYTNTALKYCKKYNKEYLIEVTGFAFEGMWYHSLKGKILAIPRELKFKKEIKKAPYAVYVTSTELQKRYPCNGKSLGCSDVEVVIEDKILDEKVNKIKNNSEMLKIGTAGFLNVKYKGQQDVLKVMNNIKKKNKELKFNYELIGAGSSKKLEKIIKKYKLEENVKIFGVIPHEEIYNWYDSLDVYLHSSYNEGLCRSIIEAMSRACPVICTDAGGNKELVQGKLLYRKRNIKELENILENLEKKLLIENAQTNFENSKKYASDYLDKIRDEFYNEFINFN